MLARVRPRSLVASVSPEFIFAWPRLVPSLQDSCARKVRSALAGRSAQLLPLPRRLQEIVLESTPTPVTALVRKRIEETLEGLLTDKEIVHVGSGSAWLETHQWFRPGFEVSYQRDKTSGRTLTSLILRSSTTLTENYEALAVLDTPTTKNSLFFRSDPPRLTSDLPREIELFREPQTLRSLRCFPGADGHSVVTVASPRLGADFEPLHTTMLEDKTGLTLFQHIERTPTTVEGLPHIRLSSGRVEIFGTFFVDHSLSLPSQTLPASRDITQWCYDGAQSADVVVGLKSCDEI